MKLDPTFFSRGLALAAALVLAAPAAYASGTCQWERTGNDIHNLNVGKVGIGTSQPGQKLDVLGGVRISGSEADDATKNSFLYGRPYDNDDPNVVYLWGKSTATASVLRLGTGLATLSSPTKLQMYTAPTLSSQGQVRMTIMPSGRVGIGTDTPQSELAVDGTITAKEVQVTLQGWPDYVFEDGYHLPALGQLEAEIDALGHLPGIPSAHEVATEGVGLADMQARLLRKVEELTLYVIELEKDNRRLATRVDALGGRD
ncbi:MAG: hypothetical protein AAGD06_15970 [Acidobacteriota bacterium]